METVFTRRYREDKEAIGKMNNTSKKIHIYPCRYPRESASISMKFILVLVTTITITLAVAQRAWGIDISGTVYDTDETTALGDNLTVNIKVNGAGAYTDETTAGAYSIAGVTASANDTITVYLDETTLANTITITDGTTNITNMHLYKDHVVIRADNSTNAIDILDLVDFDNNQDPDHMLFDAKDADPDTLIVEVGNELYINSGNSFTPGGNVTITRGSSSNKFDMNGTWNATGGETLTTSGDIDFAGGAYNSSGSDTIAIYDEEDLVGETININLNNQTFHNVTFGPSNNVGSSDIFLIEANMTVNGTLTLNRGQWTGDTTTINAKGDISLTGVSGGASTLTIEINGTGAQALSSNNTACGLPSVTINKGSNTLTITDTIRVFGDWTHQNGATTTTGSTISFHEAGVAITSNTMEFNNITIKTDGSADIISLADDLTMAGDFTLTKGVFNIGNRTLTVGGSWSDGGSSTTFTAGATSTVIFNTSSSATLDTSGTEPGEDFQDFEVDKSGGTLQLTNNGLDVDGTLTITAGTLDINGQAISSTGTIDNSGTFQLQGGESLSTTVTNNANSTVTFVGDGITAANTHTINNVAASFHHLEINDTAASHQDTFQTNNDITVAGNLNVTSATMDISTNSDKVTVTGALTVDGGTLTATSGTIDANGNVTISSGVFTAPSGNLTVAGNWNHSGDTFTHSSGTVIFDGTNQAIDGSTTFNNFTKTESNDDSTHETLTFDNTGTQTIAGLLTLDGRDTDDRINLRSNDSPNQWGLTCNGTFAIDNVDVKDSDASGGSTVEMTDASNCVDSRNNDNWAFGPDVTGTVYASDESTALTGTTRTVAVRVNDGSETTTESDANNGTFNFSSVSSSAGDTITYYLKGETEKANTITITDGETNITGVALIDDHVIIRSDHGTNAITIADLADWDNDNDSTNMLFTANSGTLTVEDSNELYINSGDTFQPGGNVTVGTGRLDINGTWTATGEELINIGGNFDASDGTLSASSNVTFNGTTDDCTIDPGSSSFKTLTINKTDTTDTVTVQNNPLTIGSNTLVIQNGEFVVTTDSTFNGDIQVQDGGSFICNTSLITLTFAADITFTVQSGGSLILNGQNYGKELKLRSGTTGSQWNLILQPGSSQDIKYVDVQDSDASGGNTAIASFSIDSGNNINWSFLGGTVYDSQTGDRIKDALVTLYKADSTIYTGTPQPNPQTTDAQGKFYFEVEAGKYYLEARHKDYQDYKGEVFTVSGSSVNENIPMDPQQLKQGTYLSIAKTVNKETAAIGDILTYTINVKNIDSSLSASSVTVTDSLPHSFKYAEGSSRLDNSPLADPIYKTAPSWILGTLTAKQSKTLTYRVIVGPDAKLGKNKNSALVTATVSGSSTSAGPSVATIQIKEGPFSKKGMIIGKVFEDINGNGKQDVVQYPMSNVEKERTYDIGHTTYDRTEPGVPHVALILEDGTQITTDEFGRYSLPNVDVGMHVLRLDQRMLPGGPLTKESTGNQKRQKKEENLIQRRSLGNWIKQALYDQPKLKAESRELKAEEDQPHYRSDIPEVSIFVQVPESGTAKCNFPIRLLTPAEEQLQKQRHAKDTQFMIVGIAEGTFGYLDSSGKVENITEGDNIGMSLKVEDKFYRSGKVVLYTKGKIKGEYLLTSRYDSSRDDHDQLYSYIRPDKYYPVYGDNSTLANDADSQGEFFIRIDKDSSFAMYGNYQTDEFAQTQLSKYSRQLHGVTASIKSDDFIKKGKGDLETKLSFFRSKTVQEKRQDIFAAKGISGPYYLTGIPILEETEEVKIEVRGKSRSDLLLRTETKSRDLDYELDYDTGRLLFREPIPISDENNDPVYVVVDYEYLSLTEDDDYYITGSRIETTFLNDQLKLGTQVITEDRESYSYNLIGLDSIWQLTPNTRVSAEWAHSKKTKAKEIGDAYRIEGSTSLLDDKLRLQTYYAQISKEFSNPVNVTERGIQKYGLTSELNINKELSLITDFWSSYALSDKIYDRCATTDLIFKNNALFLSAGYGFDERTDQKNTIEDIYKNSINLKAGKKLTEELLASCEYSWQRERYQRKFKKAINKVSPRLDLKLNEDTSMYLRHDYSRQRTRGTDKRLTNHVSSLGLVQDQDGQRSYIEYGFVGGRIESTAFGQEQDIPINDKLTLTSHSSHVITKDKNEENIGYNSQVKLSDNLYLGGAFQRTKTTGDTDYKESALSLRADYLKDTNNSLGTKLEYRRTKTKRDYNLGIDAQCNLNDDLYLLTKAEYHKERDYENNEDLKETRRLITGLGYRPTSNDKLNLLAKYEYEEDIDNTGLSLLNYTSHLASIEGIYDISPKWELFSKYALKSAWEENTDVRTHSLTDLKTVKLTYSLNSYLDLAGIYRRLQNYHTNTIKHGVAAEAGLTLFKHLRVAAGYNFLEYDDQEYPDESYQGLGPYLNCSVKVMEQELEQIPGIRGLLLDRVDIIKEKLFKARIKALSQDKKARLNAKFNQAEALYQQAKYQEARKLYREIILAARQIRFEVDMKINTRLEEEKAVFKLFHQAELLYNQGKYQEAKKLYQQILRR